MKDEVILVNLARGGVVVEDDMLDALDSGKSESRLKSFERYRKHPILQVRRLAEHRHVFIVPLQSRQFFESPVTFTSANPTSRNDYEITLKRL